MEIRTLRYFLAVAREENMSRAAKLLHVTQPTLSKQLKSLEDELGKKLFTRHSFSIQLTEEGILLRNRAEDLVGMADKIEQEFTSLDDITGGELYLGLAESYQIRYLAREICKFKKAYPNLHYHITSGDTEQIADKLDKEIYKLLQNLLKEHKKVIFNGDGYTEEWVVEAEKRGLHNYKSTPEAIPHIIDEKNIELMEKHNVLSSEELHAKYEIFLENYSKVIHIEALTMQEMVRKDVTAGIVLYMKDVTNEALKKKQLLPNLNCNYEENIITTLDETENTMFEMLAKLTEDTKKAEGIKDVLEAAKFYHDTVLADMDELRKSVDKAEAIIPNSYLPYPTYGELLFSLR